MAIFNLQHNFEDPYLTYQRLNSLGTVVWLDDLKAWFVSDEELAKQVLLSKDYTSSRNPSVQIEQSNLTEKLQTFYKSWFMYRDGESYSSEKRKILKFFSGREKQINVHEIIEKIHSEIPKEQKTFDFNLKVSERIACDCISHYMDIPTSVSKKILRLSNPIIALLGKDKPDFEYTLLACMNFSEIEILFNQSISKTVYKDLPIYPLLNIFLDGYKSLVSCLDNVAAILIKNKLKINNESINLDRLLAQEAIFQYISRISVKNQILGSQEVKRGDKIMISIGFLNRLSNHLNSNCPFYYSFGRGRHFCIGANFTKKIVGQFISLFNRTFKKMEVVEFEWMNSVGYRTMSKLKVAIIDT